jgi:hypothetical protein
MGWGRQPKMVPVLSIVLVLIIPDRIPSQSDRFLLMVQDGESVRGGLLAYTKVSVAILHALLNEVGVITHYRE